MQKLKDWPRNVALPWLKKNIFNREMIIPGILGELTFWSPLIVLAILAVFKSPGYWATFGTVYVVWVGILPAVPLQIGFIFMYKNLLKRGNK